ncbi:MAG: dihydroneopterin aldolase [Pseudomonadota bacterium]
MYEIRMKNCAFFARHGVYDQEEFLGQRFYVDAILLVDAGNALENDSIEGTVDYGRAFQVIEKIIAGERRYLIEAIALEIGRALCDEYAQIKQADITVRKPNAPVPGVLDYVEVRVVHKA